MARLATTDDPDLRLDVDGRSLAPDRIENRCHVFKVGPHASFVRLMSRAATPDATQDGTGDQRRLGVAVTRIALRGETLELFLPHDDPSFVEGFHPAEAGHRWTDGRAVLPAQWLRALQDGFTLEIELSPSTLRYPVSG